MKLRPIFIEVLPEFDAIKDGELWISHKHRTINLRCPCGCGELTVLTLHPSRWHVCFDGKSVSLDGPTGGSVWAVSGCGSHYLIRKNTVIWQERIRSRTSFGVRGGRAGPHARLNSGPSDSSFMVRTRMARPVDGELAQTE